MATYTVTSANWNDPLLRASIDAIIAGHSLDLSSLGAGFSVSIDQASGTITDGASSYRVGHSGVTGTVAKFGGTALLECFTQITSPDGADSIQGTAQTDRVTGESGVDDIRGHFGDDTIRRSARTQQDARSGDTLPRLPPVNHQPILRLDRNPAPRTAAVVKEGG